MTERKKKPTRIPVDVFDDIAKVAFTFGEWFLEGMLSSAERNKRLKELKEHGPDTSDIPRGEDAPAAGDTQGGPTSPTVS